MRFHSLGYSSHFNTTEVLLHCYCVSRHTPYAKDRFLNRAPRSSPLLGGYSPGWDILHNSHISLMVVLDLSSSHHTQIRLMATKIANKARARWMSKIQESTCIPIWYLTICCWITGTPSPFVPLRLIKGKGDFNIIVACAPLQHAAWITSSKERWRKF